MKLLKTLLLSFVFALTLASCDSDDAKQTVQYSYNNSITYVTDLTTNQSQSLEGARYIIDFDLVSGKANVDISNLYLTLGGNPTRLKIEQAAFKQDNQTGALVINVPNATSVVGGTSHNISNFRLSQSMVYIGALGQTAVYYAVSFDVDSRYSVVAVQGAAYFPGTTTISSTADGSNVAESSRTFYSYQLNRQKGEATVTVYALDDKKHFYTELSFENLPYTLTAQGIRINVENDVTAKQPSASATPFVAKAISMDSRYDTSTQIRILTDDNLIVGSLSYRNRSTAN